MAPSIRQSAACHPLATVAYDALRTAIEQLCRRIGDEGHISPGSLFRELLRASRVAVKEYDALPGMCKYIEDFVLEVVAELQEGDAEEKVAEETEAIAAVLQAAAQHRLRESRRSSAANELRRVTGSRVSKMSAPRK